MAAYGVYDLVVRADQPLKQPFTFTQAGVPANWDLYDVRMQVRHPYDGSLLIELTPLLEVDTDPSKLVLDIPASLSAKLPCEGIWDILAIRKTDTEDRIRLPERPGRFLMLEGVTQSA